MCGLLCVGCVRPSALGSTPSRPIENRYRVAVLKNASWHAKEPVTIVSWNARVSAEESPMSIGKTRSVCG